MSNAYGQNPRLTYSDYLKVPELLRLQQCLAQPVAHDELQFIVVHQVYELWFKLVLHELEGVRAALDSCCATSGVTSPGSAAKGAGQASADVALRQATHLARRVEAIFQILVPQIHVLESMRPADFLAFRAALNPASGFQSAQFREVEILMGLRDEALVRRLGQDPRLPAVLARLTQPSVPDAFYAALARCGLAVTAPEVRGATSATRPRSEAEQSATFAALRRLYEQPQAQPTIYELCEALLDIDEQLVLWRRHHVMMVERQIGGKPGTGKGTTGDLDGIRYLSTTLDKRALPDLWAVRGLLSD
ncbi:MAG: tryptophan 2,3-dioxygenase [Planctomycetota bacterium]